MTNATYWLCRAYVAWYRLKHTAAYYLARLTLWLLENRPCTRAELDSAYGVGSEDTTEESDDGK